MRSFIHIRDVADGTLRAARQAPPGEIYHFSTGLNISIRELVERICQKLGADFNERVEATGERPGKDAAYLLDSTKARQTLDWRDNISLEQGLEETISWVEKNLEELKKQPAEYVHRP